jgi:uncharacterized protein YyaL (SSP411 family)
MPTNRLATARSPYLLQHAHQPVDWWPWGAEALAEARRRNQPILLSIGYAACHWCHVMAHESFDDPETAALINRFFVPVKVDREERPDIDHLYMQALQAMGEPGGWPLTLFLTPEGRPFWGGTYFPPEPRWGKPAFRQVLLAIARAWEEERGKIEAMGERLAAALASERRAAEASPLGPALVESAAQALLGALDREQGGLAGAPKFPNAPIFRFLALYGRLRPHQAAREGLLTLLDALSRGGIYDHLGGGFARYSVDGEWRVPHFEKMLYDNGELLELLAFGAGLDGTGERAALYAERAAETIAWLEREMTVPLGEGAFAFAAALDADSEGEEGKYYVWRRAEIEAVLGAETEFFARFYEIPEEGNWEEGKIVLRMRRLPETAEERARLGELRARLAAARRERVRPARDGKVLADWNGLAIEGLARAGAAFGRPEWIARGEQVFTAITTHLREKDGRLAHAWFAGAVSVRGLLDDQAAMARAGLTLFELTGKRAYLETAEELLGLTERLFAEGEGRYYLTARDAADIPPLGRPRQPLDQATPSGVGMIAESWVRLFHLTGETAHRRRAEAVLEAELAASRLPSLQPGLLYALLMLEEGGVVRIGGEGEAAHALWREAARRAAPGFVLIPPDFTPSASHPAALPGGAGAASLVCRGGRCSLPLTSIAALAAELPA